MAEFTQSALGFVVAIGLLVTFHEWGHYYVARRLGVRVLVFSVGFGKPLWSRVAADGTRWQLAAIPLGGYVKMLDEREGPVPPEQQGEAFNRQPVGRRIAIVAAGPLANFLLAIVLYAAAYMIGQPALRPVLGPVAAESPAAQAGLREGQQVQAVAGERVRSWDELRLALIDASLGAQRLPLTVGDGLDAQRYVLDISRLSREPVEFYAGLGLVPPQVQLAPRLGQIVADAPAARAGLQSGDTVRRFDDRPVASWQALVEEIRGAPGATVILTVERAGQSLSLPVALDSVPGEGGPVGRLGAGVAAQPELWQDFAFEYRLGPVESLVAGAQQTLQMSWLTLKMLGRMVVGEVSVSNLSGPLSIAQFAGGSAAAGLVTFLGFLALISVSLGVLNLLPVPVLDGGHLLYYGIEALRGSPLPDKVQHLGQSVGLALLLGLMSVALFNDLNRLLG